MQISHSSTRPIRNGLLKRNDCRSAGVVRKLTLRGGGVEFRASRRLIYKIALYFSEVREEDSSGCRRFGSRSSRSMHSGQNLFRLASEELVDSGDVPLREIEILPGRGSVSILQRCLGFRQVCLHEFLSGGDIAAQAQALRILLSPQIVQARIGRGSLAGKLVRLLF